jgi:hypothetical protein
VIELAQIFLIAVIFAGHVSLLFEPPLAPSERQQGFAELYVDGRFVKFIDLRG